MSKSCLFSYHSKLVALLLVSSYKWSVNFSFVVDGYFIPLVQRPVPLAPKCCYFTGAGIYFFWQLGAAQYIKETCDIQSMPMIGASAGSITASLLLSGADLKSCATKAMGMGDEFNLYTRKVGLAGIWASIVRLWLERVIPDDSTAANFQNLQISVTPTLKASKLLSNFSDKADLIDAVMASCHVPLFLDGRPFTEYRGEQVVDGSLWYFVTKSRETGLPLPVGVTPEDVFWVDYSDDEEFMRSISGNILELTTAEGATEMIEAGYNFMKREHFNERLPYARYKRPFYTFSLYPSIVGRLRNISFLAAPSLRRIASIPIAVAVGDAAVDNTQQAVSYSVNWLLTEAAPLWSLQILGLG